MLCFEDGWQPWQPIALIAFRWLDWGSAEEGSLFKWCWWWTECKVFLLSFRFLLLHEIIMEVIVCVCVWARAVFLWKLHGDSRACQTQLHQRKHFAKYNLLINSKSVWALFYIVAIMFNSTRWSSWYINIKTSYNFAMPFIVSAFIIIFVMQFGLSHSHSYALTLNNAIFANYGTGKR